MPLAKKRDAGDGCEAALPDEAALAAFRAKVREQGSELYRDLPWRRTRDPYEIWISEVMLQQTQVSRVDGRWQRWLEHFPTVAALADAPLADVLGEWQGMGYNSRAKRLQVCAQQICKQHGAELPNDHKELLALPGIGPATAAGIRAFAFDLPGVYLETNVRTVLLHELFPQRETVDDKELVPLLEELCPQAGDGVRDWYYALLDYGAFLKKSVPNPSRRSKQHTRQSKFEGSHRQKRAFILRCVLDSPASFAQLAEALDAEELAADRERVSTDELRSILHELAREHMIEQRGELWAVSE